MGSGVSRLTKGKETQQSTQTQQINNNNNNNTNNNNTNNNNSNVSSSSPSPSRTPVIEPLVVPSPRRSIRNSQSESNYSRTSHSPGQVYQSHRENNNNYNDDNDNNNENENEVEESEQSSPNEQEEENLRMHFAQSAMSLGMDNDDLIFNLLYFSDATTSFQSMFNSAIEETVAAHSAENTPYKLHPASNEALGSLKVVIMTTETKLDQNECSICQEDLEPGQEIVFMPDCNHSFHNECALRWFRLQSWCPICRTEIISQTNSTSAGVSDGKHRKVSNGWKSNLNTAFEDAEMEFNGCDDDDDRNNNCEKVKDDHEQDENENENNYDDDGDGDGDGNNYGDDEERYSERDYSNSKYHYEDEYQEDDYKYHYNKRINEQKLEYYDENNDNEDDSEYQSDLKPVRSMESLMAKQTVETVMGNILSSNRY